MVGRLKSQLGAGLDGPRGKVPISSSFKLFGKFQINEMIYHLKNQLGTRLYCAQGKGSVCSPFKSSGKTAS
jgi:hypothetical protein